MRVRHLCLTRRRGVDLDFLKQHKKSGFPKSLYPPQVTNDALENSCRKAGTMGV